ncbi:hypothetical protein BBJ28_00010973, partial [Nothophytophthora sp. Chile5]
MRNRTLSAMDVLELVPASEQSEALALLLDAVVGADDGDVDAAIDHWVSSEGDVASGPVLQPPGDDATPSKASKSRKRVRNPADDARRRARVKAERVMLHEQARNLKTRLAFLQEARFAEKFTQRTVELWTTLAFKDAYGALSLDAVTYLEKTADEEHRLAFQLTTLAVHSGGRHRFRARGWVTATRVAADPLASCVLRTCYRLSVERTDAPPDLKSCSQRPESRLCSLVMQILGEQVKAKVNQVRETLMAQTGTADEALARAYAATAATPEVRGPAFWSALRGRIEDARTTRALKNRWAVIAHDVAAFVACVARARLERGGGEAA